jgi:hypothetical protein
MTFKLDGLPATVRVGPHDVRFVEMSAEESEEKYGYFLDSKMEIGLCREYAAGSVAVDTVLHELVHAIWHQSVLKEGAAEEDIAHTIGKQLTQVFRDNPELIEWMQQTVKK